MDQAGLDQKHHYVFGFRRCGEGSEDGSAIPYPVIE